MRIDQKDFTHLLNFAVSVASDYLRYAIVEIDREFGMGYARQNPDLVIQFIKTATLVQFESQDKKND
jgi:hypothetical protein